MSEAEAHQLLDAARGVMEKAQESPGIEEVPGTDGSAFVVARRSPDPNHPGRTAPGFALILIPDREAFLRDAVAAALHAVPAFEGSDTVPAGWKFPDPGAGSRTPEAGKGQEATPPGWLAFMPRPSPRFWKVCGLCFLAVVLVPTVYFILAMPRRARTLPDQNGPSTPRTDERPGIPNANEMEWARNRASIEELLRQPWARRILGEPLDPVVGNPKDMRYPSDRELLRTFARLFQRPSFTLGQSVRLDFETFPPRDHPFVAFLERLPKRLPQPPLEDTPLSAAEALGVLDDLKHEVQGSLGLRLDFDGAEGIEGPIQRRLDYDEFFNRWDRENSSTAGRRNGRLDEGGEDRKHHAWITVVRKIIQDRYLF